MTKRDFEVVDYILCNRETEPSLRAYNDLTEAQIRNMYSESSSMRKRMREESYVSCWHMNEYESPAMWKLYSQSSEAVCVQTTYCNLALLLPSWANMGLVEYIDYETGQIPIGNLFNPLLRKRKSFEHEREVRAIGWENLGETAGGPELRACLDGEGGLRAKVDLNALVQCVYVSPTSSVWFEQVVERLVNTYHLDTAVKQSKLLASPFY